jgi:Tol biopolymer transport system component
MLLPLVLTWRSGFSRDQKAGLPASAQEVTSGVHTYDQVGPACSPDGRWLAFEYHERGVLNYPHVGIMDLSQDSHPWHPLLEMKPRRHLYVGDFSWSPDSRWLAVITDYPKGKKSVWSESNLQLAKVNVYTHELVELANFSPNTSFGPTTAWLRSGNIVFAGDDQDIYAVSEKGGNVRKLINVPTDRCGGVTNTLGVSPDEQSIAFAMDGEGDNQIAECNALWIGDLRTGNLRRVPTSGLHPLSPFWLDGNTILFSGVNVDGGQWLPVGIHSVSLRTGEVSPILKGLYESPFVCDSGKTLYFSWGPELRTKTPAVEDWPTVHGFYGFHIWKVPLRDVLRTGGPETNSETNLGALFAPRASPGLIR